jgi:SAM-dependent methyltransferase
MPKERGCSALDEALRRVEALYTDNLREHGIDSRSVGWPDQESQLLRFRKLAYVIEADRPAAPITVNDWGCGYGALFDFLSGLEGLELAGYRGYDVSADMVTAARERLADPRAAIVLGSEVDRDADYTFVSGTFNVRMEADEDAWGGYVRDMVRALAARSLRGLAFNLLTTYVDWRKDELYYADPCEYLRFCKSELSRQVTLIHDYPLYEWTLVVLKDDRP